MRRRRRRLGAAAAVPWTRRRCANGPARMGIRSAIAVESRVTSWKPSPPGNRRFQTQDRQGSAQFPGPAAVVGSSRLLFQPSLDRTDARLDHRCVRSRRPPRTFRGRNGPRERRSPPGSTAGRLAAALGVPGVRVARICGHSRPLDRTGAAMSPRRLREPPPVVGTSDAYANATATTARSHTAASPTLNSGAGLRG
jgi:hypothetical protein